VRLKSGFWGSGNIYSVTAQLPPSGDSPQYRIRSEAEKFDRMATQANLEAVIASAPDENAALLEKSFSMGDKGSGLPRTDDPTPDHARGEEAGEQRGRLNSRRS
jgi:hypothetical protein